MAFKPWQCDDIYFIAQCDRTGELRLFLYSSEDAKRENCPPPKVGEMAPFYILDGTVIAVLDRLDSAYICLVHNIWEGYIQGMIDRIMNLVDS